MKDYFLKDYDKFNKNLKEMNERLENLNDVHLRIAKTRKEREEALKQSIIEKEQTIGKLADNLRYATEFAEHLLMVHENRTKEMAAQIVKNAIDGKFINDLKD